MTENRTEIICPPEPSVFVWPAAYFNTSTKKWENGELQVTPSTLCFYNVATKPTSISTPEKQARSLVKLICLDNIADIKKASSSYVFKCIVVLMKDGEEQWFGSLPGRDGAYNVLLHFWRERLLGSSLNKSSEGNSSMGKELLSIAHESAETLKEAGETLKRQGEQLEHTRSMMFDMHNDLDIANHLTTSLESWYSHWGMNRVNVSLEPVHLIDSSGVPVIHEFPILYHEAENLHKGHQSQSLLTKVHLSPKRGPPIQEQSGYLNISPDGVTLLDDEHKPVQHYRPSDISLVSVSSPWKITITKYCIGEPDIVYKVTSTQMLDILKVMHSIAHDKIQYQSPVGEPVIPASSEDFSDPFTEHQQLEVTVHAQPAAISGHNLSIGPQPSTSLSLGPSGEQPQAAGDEVKVEEIKQLSELLGGMKSLALDIQKEEDKQLESIDSLTDTVDKAKLKMENITHRMTKLT